MRYLRSILTSLVFLHALLTAPLLVECIPPDGQYLVEILGQDPCHPHHERIRPPSEPEFNAAAITAADGETDPCADLILDSYYDTSICADLLIPAPQARDKAAHPRDHGAQPVQGAGIRGPELEPVVLDGFTAFFPPVLRI
jgi:hypothetical protein